MRIGHNDELFAMIAVNRHILVRGRSKKGKAFLNGTADWFRVKAIKGKNVLAIANDERLWVKGPNCPDYYIDAVNTGRMIVGGRKAHG